MKRVPWGGTISRPLQYDGRHCGDEDDETSNFAFNPIHKWRYTFTPSFEVEDYIDGDAELMVILIILLKQQITNFYI